jgi:hypothetical protein
MSLNRNADYAVRYEIETAGGRLRYSLKCVAPVPDDCCWEPLSDLMAVELYFPNINLTSRTASVE